VQRQVVTIQIQGDKTRVDVTPATPAATGEKWDEERFFSKAEGVPEPLRQFLNDLRRLRDDFSDVTLAPGRGAAPTLTLRKSGKGILTFNLDGSGSLSFNKQAFSSVLGEQWGEHYRKKLEALFPEEMERNYPTVKLRTKTTDRDLLYLSTLLQEVLAKSPHTGALATAPIIA
jgi:hypothetical protein